MKTISEVRKKGWQSLIKELGVKDATRFIMEYERGQGDYTKARKNVFKNKSLPEIIKEINKIKGE